MDMLSKAAWKRWLVPSAILALALALRLHGLRSGLPAINDPDELMFQLGALKMLSGRTLNPGWFGHPALITMYALAVADVLVFLAGHLTGQFADVKAFGAAVYADPSVVMFPGRVVMMLFSLGTVWLAWRFAKRQWGPEAGLAAAAILAVSPVFVVWSQVIRSDIVGCFFLLLAMLAAQRITDGSGRKRDLIFAALWTACAIASKWPFAMLGLGVAGALVFEARKRALPLRQLLGRLAAYSVLTVVFLVAISPYLLLDFSTVMRDVSGEAQARHLGIEGGTPLLNAWWYLSGPFSRAFGVTAGALAALGVIRLGKDPAARAIIGPQLAGFSILLVSQHLVWERWALPLILLLSLLVGEALGWVAQSLRPRARLPGGVLYAILGVLLLAQPIHDTIIQANARNNDTRQRASTWAVQNFRPNSKVLVEHFAFDLLPRPWTFYFPLGEAGCVNANDWLTGKVNYAKIAAKRGNRTNVDYGTLAPEQEGSCRLDYAILSQYDRYLAERQTYPGEVASYERLIARGRIVATFAPVPGQSSGPIVRIIAF